MKYLIKNYNGVCNRFCIKNKVARIYSHLSKNHSQQQNDIHSLIPSHLPKRHTTFPSLPRHYPLPIPSSTDLHTVLSIRIHLATSPILHQNSLQSTLNLKGCL